MMDKKFGVEKKSQNSRNSSNSGKVYTNHIQCDQVFIDFILSQ